MDITLKENTPLISIKDGVFTGEVNLMNNIDSYSKMAGLINNELYWAILKEYKRYQGLYDLSTGGTVMNFRLFHIANEFGLQSRNLDIAVDWMRDTHLTSARFIFNHYIMANKSDIYPIINVELAKDLIRLFESLTPYFDRSQIPADKLTDLKDWLKGHMVLSFYSDWVEHLKYPERWINIVVKRIKSLPIDENSRVMYNNTLERFNESLNGQVYNFDPVPSSIYPWWERAIFKTGLSHQLRRLKFYIKL